MIKKDIRHLEKVKKRIFEKKLAYRANFSEADAAVRNVLSYGIFSPPRSKKESLENQHLYV